MKKLIFAILLAALLWAVMFSPLTAPYVPFWWMMTGSAVVLASLSALFCPGWWERIKWSPMDFLLGAGIAAVLWGIFWTGDKVAAWLFDFARPQVDAIYGIKAGESPWLLTVLMLFLIGPAEEIFWRGYVQKTFSDKIGPDMAFVVSTIIYACRFLQFYARDGGFCCRGCLGSYIPFFPAALSCCHRLACIVGCGRIHLVPDLRLSLPVWLSMPAG